MVQGQNYKADASNFPNQILSIFNRLPKICEVSCCRDGRRRFSYWSIFLSIAWHNLSSWQ